jgi:hypothetical protein
MCNRGAFGNLLRCPSRFFRQPRLKPKLGFMPLLLKPRASFHAALLH